MGVLSGWMDKHAVEDRRVEPELVGVGEAVETAVVFELFVAFLFLAIAILLKRDSRGPFEFLPFDD